MKYIISFIFLSFFLSCSQSEESTIEEHIAQSVEPTIKKPIVPDATVFSQRANDFYLGMNNYLTIITPHHTPDEIEVKASGGKILKQNGKYVYRVKNPGNVSISIIDKNSGAILKKERFSVRRIPCSTARLGRHDSGHLDVGTIKAQGGIGVWIDNFNINGMCKTISYNISLVRSNTPIVKLTNEGARFQGKASQLIYDVEKDDILLFDEIRCLCPGDKVARKVNSLIFWVD